MRRDGDSHPLLTEIRLGRLVGWPLLAVTAASGLGCGLIAIAVADVGLVSSPAWLAIPACIPVCYSLVRGRSLLMGTLGGLFAAVLAFMTLGLYGLWQVACFIITFMGEC